jgi:hypothetical protein
MLEINIIHVMVILSKRNQFFQGRAINNFSQLERECIKHDTLYNTSLHSCRLIG